MRKIILRTLIVIVAYCAIYIIGQPVATRIEPLSHVWATAFYPLRLIQFRHMYSTVRHEQGVLQQDTTGEWGLTFVQPKRNSQDGHLTQGISFRVPAHLSDATAAAKSQLVNVTIGSEPDSRHFNCATYVLTSVTLPR